MEAYEEFARVYDLFMEDTPYEAWGNFIIEKLLAWGIQDGLVLDLGCGTGRMTRFLAGRGYDMTGVDASFSMLQEAQERQAEETSSILYLCQDMREFELYGTMRAVVSCCDCINYITEEEDLIQVFRLVNNYLDPGGIFFFDFNTEAKYRKMGEETYAENRDKGSFIWENYYDEEERINEYGLTLFIRREDGLYEKQEEFHFQKGYRLEDIRRCLEEAGMEYIEAVDNYVNQPAGEDSERICVIAREKGKEQG